jgi:small-conductance mechanosensitive channel
MRMFDSRALEWLKEPLGDLRVWQWLGLVLGPIVAIAVGRFAARVAQALAMRAVRRTPSTIDNVVVEAVHAPLRLLCSLLLAYTVTRFLELPDEMSASIATVTRAGTIGILAWGVIRVLNAVARAVANGTIERETADWTRLAQTRSLRTKVIVANRVISVLIFLVGSALVALQFQVVRSVGMSLLASAGVAGVVLGFAAQKSLGALLAGIQLSLSQPIRIGDSVVIEGEFGTIEDIGLTYVAVRLWDERRLIVPTPRFLEQPFQNWSRTSAGLLGTIMLRVDFDLPVAQLRAELQRLIAEEPLWDRRVANIQVTDAGENSLELRVLVSARTPPALWDLRVSVREKLVAWLQAGGHGNYVPRSRVLWSGIPTEPVNGHEPGRVEA